MTRRKPYAQTKYEETKNPVWAGRAYREARHTGTPIPAWVLEYLDRAFANVEGLLHDHKPGKRAIAPAIAAAFGFVRGGVAAEARQRRQVGRWNPLEVMDRDLPIALTIWLAVSGGSKLLHAYEDAAAQHQVTRRTAERAWAKHKNAL